MTAAPESDRISPVVDVESLWVRFGSVDAVRGIDLQVAPGAATALLGRNGAGKSTTMRVLAGVIPPTDGLVTVCGHDIRTDWRAARRLRVTPSGRAGRALTSRGARPGHEDARLAVHVDERVARSLESACVPVSARLPAKRAASSGGQAGGDGSAHAASQGVVETSRRAAMRIVTATATATATAIVTA